MAGDNPGAFDRGHGARSPAEIPRGGWADVAVRVRRACVRGDLSVVAAGVTFFVLLSIVPALAAVAAVLGVMVDPTLVGRHADALGYALPDEVQQLLEQQLVRLAALSRWALGVGTLGGVLSIWSALRAARAIMAAVNLAYGELETRSFVRRQLTAAGIALGLLLAIVVALVIGIAVPIMLGESAAAASAIALLRWPALVGLLTLALAALYRYAPSRASPRWSWTSPGALVGALLWLMGSVALSLLVSGPARYEAIYGSLGAVVVLMMWIYVGAYAVLLGAVVNAEAERQTTRDTTTGACRPDRSPSPDRRARRTP